MGFPLTPSVLAVATVLLGAPGVPLQKKDTSKELAELYRSDQDDQNRYEQIPEAEFGRRQKERRDRAAEIVLAGELRKPIDYYHAAMLFQHGESVDDFLLAHILATAGAFERDAESFFLSGAALDRFLMNLGQPQRFGTQSFDEYGRDLGDTSALLSEAIVRVFRDVDPSSTITGMTGRPLDEELRTRKLLKRAAKDLKKLGRSARKLAGKKDAADEIAAALERTLEIVHAGQLEEPDDFLRAATVLHHLGDGTDHAVLAHVLTTAAGLRKHKNARKLYVETLDRMLAAFGRPPVFAAPEAGTTRPAILELHKNVRTALVGKR